MAIKQADERNLTCKNLEYRKNYVFPYRCLKHKAERFSEKELHQMCFSGEECSEYEDMDRRPT